jgi:polysaccharide export outer membrane protein
MTIFLRIIPLLVLLLGVHACATSSGGSSMVVQPTADPVTAAAGASQPELKGDLVPAVIGIPDDPGPERTYRIGPYDLIKIDVFQVQELSRQERVNDEGFVTLPLIGTIRLAGLTPREAEQLIAAKLAEEYLQDPQVNIFVSEYASQKVTVTGQVKKPGVFPVAGRTTLMQAIALAGGLDEVAKKEEVVVFRKQPTGSVSAYVVNMASIEEGKLTDPVIVGDDRIVVPKSGAAVFSRAVGNIIQGWVIRAPVY